MIAFYVFYNRPRTMDVIASCKIDTWQCHITAAEGADAARTLLVAGTGVLDIPAAAKVRDLILEYGCTSFIVPSGVAWQTFCIFGVYVVCIVHEDTPPASLTALLSVRESPVAQVWPLFIFFAQVNYAKFDDDGMITCDTKWMLEDSYIDYLTNMQERFQRLIKARGTVCWGMLATGRPEIREIGGISTEQLENLARCLLAAPQMISFPDEDVACSTYAALLYGGIFIRANNPGDRRLPSIYQLLCMLDFIFQNGKRTVDETGRVVYDKLPRQLDWPTGGEWGQSDEVLRKAQGTLCKLEGQLVLIGASRFDRVGFAVCEISA
ncbi:MAG: hypothetical protein LBD72_00535 [Puniceicoccales bacterium]|nr:hypothetical protein [Puniceicoccales bacterium]